MKVPIACPEMGALEKAAVLGVLESGQLVQGARVKEFEEGFARLHDARHAVAVSNGTTALSAALLAHGIGPGDEVLTPAFSFFATVSSVLGVGAIPILVDIRPETFTIDPELIASRITPKTRALLAVHLYGHPADLVRLEAICDERGLILIQDAAQAHLAAVGKNKVGSRGTACFSFYASKNMTTGEGGMVLTDDPAIFERLSMIRNQGRNQKGEHELLGSNWRMTELVAAIGCAQLTRLPKWTSDRARNAAFYSTWLRSDPRLSALVRAPCVVDGYTHCFHQYTVEVLEPVDRNEVLRRLHEAGVDARVYYPRGMHREPLMERLGLGRGVFPHTERASRSVLSLPVHPHLTPGQLGFVMEELSKALFSTQLA